MVNPAVAFVGKYTILQHFIIIKYFIRILGLSGL